MWRLGFGDGIDAWAAIPSPDEERHQLWSDAVARALATQWGDLQARFGSALEDVLAHLLASRPADALADLVSWPLPVSDPARVTFVLLPSDDTVDWAEAGFVATPYPHGPFGGGVQYARRTPEQLSPGIDCVDAMIVFDRGDHALHVRVHPCPTDVYAAAGAAVAELIDGCVLEDADGRPFRSRERRCREAGEADVWSELGARRG